MTTRDYPTDFLDRLKSVRGKRSRIVVDHILKHGHITSEELQRTYGYEHPPRAVRDVREQGIPIEAFSVVGADGKQIAAYRFGDPTEVRGHALGGRSVLPKKLKQALISEHGCRCAICLCRHEARYLQVDHRIPYEVAGDQSNGEPSTADFMLLCGSCNRAKSWSCENCPNWNDDQVTAVCGTCYWARPEGYDHIALQDTRRLEVVWAGEETGSFDRLRARAEAEQVEMPDYVKRILDKYAKRVR